MRLKLISCQVFCREMAAVMKNSPHEIDVEFLSKGLHEVPCSEMCRRIQCAVDHAQDVEAVMLAYGFCNHGLVGLRAGVVPLVLPRAHDCIDVLLGRRRAAEYRESNPGAYFQSSGWVEHRNNPHELEALSPARQNGLYSSLEEFANRYGPENAKYLHDLLSGHTRHYGKLAYIRGGFSVDDRYAAQTAAEAARRTWQFEELSSDLSLLQRLVNGDWMEEDFLVVQPGQQVAACYDSHIIQPEPAQS